MPPKRNVQPKVEFPAKGSFQKEVERQQAEEKRKREAEQFDQTHHKCSAIRGKR